jgi:hypothetical protein
MLLLACPHVLNVGVDDRQKSIKLIFNGTLFIPSFIKICQSLTLMFMISWFIYSKDKQTHEDRTAGSEKARLSIWHHFYLFFSVFLVFFLNSFDCISFILNKLGKEVKLETLFSGHPVTEMFMPVHRQSTCRYVNMAGWSNQIHLLISEFQWCNRLCIFQTLFKKTSFADWSVSINYVACFAEASSLEMHALAPWRWSALRNYVPLFIYCFICRIAGS